MLTLVRDTYRAADDIGELLGLRDAAGHPASSEDIAGHLLDRVLPAAYTAAARGTTAPLRPGDRGTRAAAHRHADERRRHPRSAMALSVKLA